MSSAAALIGPLPQALDASIRRRYLLATGLFVALFSGSIVLGLVDIDSSYAEYRHLGFPVWTFTALTAAKFFGLVAVLSNRSRTLKDFAFAGFLFDLLLALGAHIDRQEPKLLLPIFGLSIWGFAFAMNRKVFP
jgi:membrane-bound metal-dependent hydrolase YbcI (DUF457 family)